MPDLFAYNTETHIQLVAYWCNGCGIPYGLPAGFIEQRRKDSETWTCPNGCKRHFPPGESDADKLRKAEARNIAMQDQLEAAVRDAERERSLRARDRQRIANGVCPCCNRYFANVHRHITSEHPDYPAPDKAATFECSCGCTFETYRGLRVHQGKSRDDDWARSKYVWRQHLTVGAS